MSSATYPERTYDVNAASTYPERPYDANATAQAPPTSPPSKVPGTNTTTTDAKSKAQAQAAQAQEKARQLGNQVANHPAMQQAQASAAEYHARADKALSQYPAMNTLEQRTGVPKTYLAAGGAGLMALLVSVNALAAPASNLVGWGLPAYMSMKAIETQSGQDDVQWLTYWVIFGFLTYLESFALRIVLYYFPWYFAAKTVFVVWLQLPQTKGASTLYHAAIRPSMDRARVQASGPTSRYPATNATQNAPAGYGAQTVPAGYAQQAPVGYAQTAPTGYAQPPAGYTTGAEKIY